MASQSQGIQQLLQAEKRAAEKVAEARKREWPAWLRREEAGLFLRGWDYTSHRPQPLREGG